MLNTHAEVHAGLNLRDFDVFTDLGQDELDELSHYMKASYFGADQIIYAPEQPAETVFFLALGSVKMYRLSPEGRVIVNAIMEIGDVFGELLSGDALYRSYAETLTECCIFTMTRENAERFLFSNFRVTRRLLQLQGKRIADLEYQLSVLGLKPVPDRVKAILLFLYRQVSTHPDRSSEIKITHEELAHLIAANRESVTKVLNTFQLEGLLE